MASRVAFVRERLLNVSKVVLENIIVLLQVFEAGSASSCVLLLFNQHKILLWSSGGVQCGAVHGAEMVQNSALLPPGMEICSDSLVNSQAGKQS